jgi:uncharacterized pyridoxamine 5'-phosphate oxidase family protein
LQNFDKPDLSLGYIVTEEGNPLISEGVVLEIQKKRNQQPLVFCGVVGYYPFKYGKMLGQRTGIDPIDDIWHDFYQKTANQPRTDHCLIGVSFPGDAPEGYSSYFVGQISDGSQFLNCTEWTLPEREYIVCSFDTVSEQLIINMGKAMRYTRFWLNRIMTHQYEEGIKLLEEKFGHFKDNVIALATTACDKTVEGHIQPVVREVDAFYEEGVFYVSTHEQSNKIKQIKKNPAVSIAVSGEWFTAVGQGENLGWVLDPKNAELRCKIRKAFVWYDEVNNENDKGCCFLAIHLTKGTLNINHWEKLYHFDFEKKVTMEDGGIY